MNETRRDEQIKRNADRVHEHAQKTGDPYAYLKAAQLYNACGDYKQERQCMEAVDALMKATE